MITSHIRPGRPPKRVLPFPAPSPQDAMLQLNRSPLVTPDNFSRWVWPPWSSQHLTLMSREAGGHPMDGGRFPGAPGGGSFPGGHPMTAAGAAHLMSLNNPAALLSRTGNDRMTGWRISTLSCCRHVTWDARWSGGVTRAAPPARGPWPRPPGELQAAVRGLCQAPPGVSHHPPASRHPQQRFNKHLDQIQSSQTHRRLLWVRSNTG